MTTAHRPTYNAATGGSSGNTEGYWSSGGLTSRQFSSRDLPSQLTLKTRQPQQVQDKDRAQMLEELARKEAAHRDDVRKQEQSDAIGESLLIESRAATLLLKNESEASAAVRAKYDDADDETSDDDDDSDGGGSGARKTRPIASNAATHAANETDSSSESESDTEDDEDETAELMRELEKIKAEREAARLKRAAEEQAVQREEHEAEMARGNPLSAAASDTRSATMKRRWNHDVVFKNQARDEPETKKRFVNDTIRNDFHRRFLSKYIQ